MTEVATATEQVIEHKPFYLWWENKEGKRAPAGVAFYCPEYGEYRLKLDIFPGTPYYLRPTKSENSEVSFAVESVLRRHGRFIARKIVGDGFSDSDFDGDIRMCLYPFEKNLVLVANA